MIVKTSRQRVDAGINLLNYRALLEPNFYVWWEQNFRWLQEGTDPIYDGGNRISDGYKKGLTPSTIYEFTVG